MFSRNSRFLSLSIFLLALIIFPLTEKTYAQLDPTFGTNGVVTTNLGPGDTTLATYVLPDGKIFVVAASYTNNRQTTYFVKYNSNGTPDSTYGTNGIIQLPIPYFSVSGKIANAARQTDGKIVLAGYDYTNGFQRFLVTRFNEDGTIDTSFAGSGISRPILNQADDAYFFTVSVLPDGKILLGGLSEVNGNGQFTYCLARYLSNGSVDTSFGSNGTGFIIDSLIAGTPSGLQSSGKIIVRGNGRISRCNADGTVDNSFTPILFPGFDELQTVIVQPDDKILTGTQFSKTEAVARTHTDSLISRFNADGTPDTSFGTNGRVAFDVANFSDDSPKGLQVMPDGQVLVALQVSIEKNRSTYRGGWVALARLASNGAVNGKFLVTPSNDSFNGDITTLPDGKILTALRGTGFNGYHSLIVRVTGVPLKNYIFHSLPFYFGLFGSATDASFYRQSNNSFTFGPVGNVINTGFAPGDILVSEDFVGRMSYDLAYFRPSNGTWYIVQGLNSVINITTVRWGADGDIPAPADYNGDGKADPAVFRPSDGNWYIYHIADGSYSIVHWGASGDIPVPGDYDGDGIYDRAVFRPTTGEWWILRSSDNGYMRVDFGAPGDIPVQEDYDGDGKFDIAVYRPSTGVWYRINSSDISFFAFQWGIPGDIPVPGNYDNDQKANVAIWRPANGTWYIVNPDYGSMFTITGGMNGDRPLPGKY